MRDIPENRHTPAEPTRPPSEFAKNKDYIIEKTEWKNEKKCFLTHTDLAWR